MADVFVLCSVGSRNRMEEQASMVPAERQPAPPSMAETAGSAMRWGVPLIALLAAGYVGYSGNQNNKQQQKDLAELSVRLDEEITKTVTERTQRIMEAVDALEEKLKTAEDALKKSTIEVQTLQQEIRRQNSILEVLGYPSPLQRGRSGYGHPQNDGYGPRGDGYRPSVSDGYGPPRNDGYRDDGYSRAPPYPDNGYGYSRGPPPQRGNERHFEQSEGSYGGSFATDIANL